MLTWLLGCKTCLQISNYWHKPSLHHKASDIPRSSHTQKNHTARHYNHWSNQPIINIVISDILDMIHHKILGCILSFRSNKSIITHYIHTFFRSKYSWKYSSLSHIYHYDLHLLIYLIPYRIPWVKTILMLMVFLERIKYPLLGSKP